MTHQPLLAAAFVPAHDHAAFSPHGIAVPASLRPSVAGLLAVEVGPIAPNPLFIAPHESMVLSVQLGRVRDACIEAKGEHGQNTCVTGIRQWTGSFIPAGRCVTLFALLTPLGAVHVLDSQPLSQVPRIRAPVADLLDRRTTMALESAIALAPSIDTKLKVFASWLEARVTARRQQSWPALRAARAALHLMQEPGAAIDDLAREAAVSRRQLERHFAHWFGTSPRHLAQVARLQQVSRCAQQGATLADIAAHTGFADQAHMTRVVRQLTGLTPRRFVQSHASPLAGAFRAATHGGTVYL
jgi:AraC-like DNA-binding protein